jgi:hypothetical protein
MSFRLIENALLAMDALDANWNESLHPRKGGKFTSKGGGQKGGKWRRAAENMNIAFNPFARVPMEEVTLHPRKGGKFAPKGGGGKGTAGKAASKLRREPTVHALPGWSERSIKKDPKRAAQLRKEGESRVLPGWSDRMIKKDPVRAAKLRELYPD